MLLLQLLFLMFSLVMVGEPLRFLLSRYINFFKELDRLQICVIDVYFAGLLFYIIAVIPLHLFTFYTVWGITISSFIFSIFLHRKNLEKVILWFQHDQKNKYLYRFFQKNGIQIFKEVVVFGMFIISLWVQLAPLFNFVLGTIHDTALHALFVELILENGHIPATHQPYLEAAIIYPQGAHVFFAYSCCILQLVPPKAVFYVSPLFNAMTVIAAYFLGKKIRPGGNLDIVFAFVMAFISMWPTYVTWGSNPFILGFPLYLLCLSFFPYLYDYSINIKRLFVISILFGFLGVIHIAFYEVIIVSSLLWLFLETYRKPHKIYKVGIFLGVFILSIFPAVPFLYRYISYYHYPGHNIGLPNDIVADPTSIPTPSPDPPKPNLIEILMTLPSWLFLNYNIQPNVLLRVLWVFMFLASLFTLIHSFRKTNTLQVTERIALITIGGSLLLNICTYVFPVIPWGRVSFVMYISACLLITIFFLKFHPILKAFYHHVFIRKNKIKALRTGVVVTLIAILILPFVHYRIWSTPRELAGLYRAFAITTESDYELMMWMRSNLPTNAVILVSPYECGGFIPSISQKKAIYPLSGYWLSLSYRKTINLIIHKTINETLCEHLETFGITHIFVGSNAIKYWGKTKLEENPKWDPLLFLGNPNFRLVANIGNSYLFNFSYNDADVVFQEDFEFLDLTQMRWNFIEMEEGNYNLTIIQDEKNNNLLRAVVVRNKSSRLLYSCFVNRKVYLPDSTNVTLSFYLNATNVKPPNTVSISIFDASKNRYITFATPSVLYGNKTNVETLISNYGNFSYDISYLWEKTFNESLPSAIIVELAFVNIVSSSPTDALFDNIIITINSD